MVLRPKTILPLVLQPVYCMQATSCLEALEPVLCVDSDLAGWVNIDVILFLPGITLGW